MKDTTKLRLNIKKFLKIVSITVISFLIMGAFFLTTFLAINPDFLRNNLKHNLILKNLVGPVNPINILFLGMDKVSGNTDVIVFVNFNPMNKKVSVVSIPRDTKVKYNERSYKINSMYAKGKESFELAKEKVGELINQKIDYAILTNPEGFRNIIDILGGVEVNIPRDMHYDDYEQNYHIHLNKGVQILDGKKAEQFIRYRSGYVNGDLGRIDAQQIFFKAFVEQKLKPKYILNAPQILNEIYKHVKTDMPLSEAIKYSFFAKDLQPENIKFYKLPGEAKLMHGIWYFIPDSEETQKLMEEIFNNKEENQTHINNIENKS